MFCLHNESNLAQINIRSPLCSSATERVIFTIRTRLIVARGPLAVTCGFVRLVPVVDDVYFVEDVRSGVTR